MQVVTGWTVWPGGLGQESYKEWGEMLVVDLRVDVQRTFEFHAHRCQLVRSRKLDLVTVNSRAQSRQRPEIIHGVGKRSAKRLFKVDARLENHRLAVRSVSA